MSESSLSSPLSSAKSVSDVEIPDIADEMSEPISPPPPNVDEESSNMSPDPEPREESPPHEEVLADNPDIAFIVMFRARFDEAFPQKLVQFGPQDIERGVVDSEPSESVENLLCALIGLTLNRKKPVERGHHTRAMEDCISSQKSQWPVEWNGQNPLSGNKNFTTMTPTERLILLRALAMWSLNSSEAITHIIKESYKQSRHDDDLNQPLSVHPWGRDAQKRRYWLVEGKDDTPFRLYRETNPYLKKSNWRSMAGSIEELREISEKLEKDGSQHAKRLSARILNSLDRFEATEEKRRRREYRQARKLAFARPEPGFSMYEGRTRGKRMKYTYSDEEDMYLDTSDAPDVRRSARGFGGAATTSSGRQVRTRYGNLFGTHEGARESPATDGWDRSDGSAEPNGHGRSTRSGRNLDSWVGRGFDDDEEGITSGEEWQGEDEMEDQPDEEEEMTEATDEDMEPQSLIVTLQYKKPVKKEEKPAELQQSLPPPTAPTASNGLAPKSEPASHPVPFNGFAGSAPVQPNQVPQEQNQPTLPSFSKFLYNPVEANKQQQTPPQPLPAQAPLQQPPAASIPQQSPSSTIENNNHHRPW